MVNYFNIRVYGLLIEQGSILVTDEFRLGIFMTKFPGGGLQFGEGTLDCLRREFMEEMNATLTEINHYYTTDFFQQTLLIPAEMQLLSIYYKVKVQQPFPFVTTDKKFDIGPVDGAQSFRWVKLEDLDPEEFTFPIDRHIARKISDENKGLV